MKGSCWVRAAGSKRRCKGKGDLQMKAKDLYEYQQVVADLQQSGFLGKHALWFCDLQFTYVPLCVRLLHLSLAQIVLEPFTVSPPSVTPLRDYCGRKFYAGASWVCEDSIIAQPWGRNAKGSLPHYFHTLVRLNVLSYFVYLLAFTTWAIGYNSEKSCILFIMWVLPLLL